MRNSDGLILSSIENYVQGDRNRNSRSGAGQYRYSHVGPSQRARGPRTEVTKLKRLGVRSDSADRQLRVSQLRCPQKQSELAVLPGRFAQRQMRSPVMVVAAIRR